MGTTRSSVTCLEEAIDDAYAQWNANAPAGVSVERTITPVIGTVVAPRDLVARATQTLLAKSAFPAPARDTGSSWRNATTAVQVKSSLDKLCVVDKGAFEASSDDEHNRTLVEPLQRLFGVTGAPRRWMGYPT